MLKNLSEKLGAKFSCHYTSMTLPETFFNPKQARERANHSSKKKTEGKMEREKKN